MMNLANKCAIVTGGSSGIGKCLAKEFAQRQANVFLIARRNDVLKEALDEVRRNAKSSGQRFGCCAADVADFTAVENAIREAEIACGPTQMLVNCAGYVNPGYVENLSIESMETELKVNYLGTVYTIKQVINGMIERRTGWILNVSSLGGLKGIFGYTSYSGSKFAVVGFSEALRSELRPYKIGVSVLCPPDVDTPMFENENKAKPLETLRISEGAKLMKPEEVAKEAIHGMEKGRFIIIPNLPGKMFNLANRLAPSLVNRFLDKTVDKVRRERGL